MLGFLCIYTQVTKRQQLAGDQSDGEDGAPDSGAGPKARKRQVMKRPVANLSVEDKEPLSESEATKSRGRGNGRGRGRGRATAVKPKKPGWAVADEWTKDEWEEYLKFKAQAEEEDPKISKKTKQGQDETETPNSKKARTCNEDETESNAKAKRKSNSGVAASQEADETPSPDRKVTFGGRKQPASGLPHLKWQVIRDSFADHVRPHIHVNRSRHEAGFEQG